MQVKSQPHSLQLKQAQKAAEAAAKAREDLEKDIANEEKKRKEAIARRKALKKEKMSAEELAREEERKRAEAKEKVKKKVEKRRIKAEEARQRKQLADAESAQAAEAVRMEVSMKLNDLKAHKDTMSKEEYILARIKIKAVTVNFDVIGSANGRSDDLQQVDGIDGDLEGRLNTLGITTLEQLSKMDDEAAEDVNDAIEYMPGRIRRQLWAEQAKILLE